MKELGVGSGLPLIPELLIPAALPAAPADTARVAEYLIFLALMAFGGVLLQVPEQAPGAVV